MDLFANFHLNQTGALAGAPLHLWMAFLGMEALALPYALVTLVREGANGMRTKREAGATWVAAALVFAALMLVSVLVHLAGLVSAIAGLGIKSFVFPAWVTIALTHVQGHLRAPSWFWVHQPYALVALQWAFLLQGAAHAGLLIAGWPAARIRHRRALDLLARLERGPEPECAPDTGRRTVRYF